MKRIAIFSILYFFSIATYAWTAAITIRTGKDGKIVQKFGYVKDEFKLNEHDIKAPKPFSCKATLSGFFPGLPTEFQSPRNVNIDCSLTTSSGTVISHNFRCDSKDDGLGLLRKGIVSMISVSCEDD